MRMKKHLLSMVAVLLFGAVTANAQSFEFRYHGQPVADGGMIIIAAEENDYGELACETNHPNNPADGLVIVLLNGSSSTLTAKLEVEYNTLNPTTLQWCMGGRCEAVSEALTKSNFSVGETELVQFEAIDIKQTGYLLAKLTISRALEAHTIYIQFTNGESAGVTNIHNITNADGAYYTLDGRRIEHPVKGIYIQNGHKFIAK